jgi:ubiquinone/menaquinone biosynthesis C-methylase UbiE
MAFANPIKNIEELNLREGMRVADLGSGTGHYSFEAARKVGEEGRVFAVDVQKNLLTKVQNEAIKQNLNQIEIIWGDFEKAGGSKLADQSVDAVILSNILFQVDEKEALLTEVKRIIRSNGEILVIDWSDSFAGLGPRPEDIFSKEKAKELFQRNGFKIEREISPGENHYGFIAKVIQ